MQRLVSVYNILWCFLVEETWALGVVWHSRHRRGSASEGRRCPGAFNARWLAWLRCPGGSVFGGMPFLLQRRRARPRLRDAHPVPHPGRTAPLHLTRRTPNGRRCPKPAKNMLHPNSRLIRPLDCHSCISMPPGSTWAVPSTTLPCLRIARQSPCAGLRALRPTFMPWPTGAKLARAIPWSWNARESTGSPASKFWKRGVLLSTWSTPATPNTCPAAKPLALTASGGQNSTPSGGSTALSVPR